MADSGVADLLEAQGYAQRGAWKMAARASETIYLTEKGQNYVDRMKSATIEDFSYDLSHLYWHISIMIHIVSYKKIPTDPSLDSSLWVKARLLQKVGNKKLENGESVTLAFLTKRGFEVLQHAVKLHYIDLIKHSFSRIDLLSRLTTSPIPDRVAYFNPIDVIKYCVNSVPKSQMIIVLGSLPVEQGRQIVQIMKEKNGRNGI